MNKEDLLGLLNDGASVEDIELALAGEKALGEVLTVPEAAEIWQKDVSTIKKACTTGRLHSWEAVKALGSWKVTRAGMRRVFGEVE